MNAAWLQQRWPNAGLAFVAGAVMPFAFAPYDQLWLAVLGMTLWAWLLQHGGGFVSGLAFGLGWFGLGAWWLADTLHIYGHVPYVLAWLCVLVVGLVLALFPALWAWLAVRFAANRWQFFILFTVLGMAEEWLRGHLLTGLPWTALGNLLLDTPAVGWLAVLGVYGATWLVCALAAAVALLVAHPARNEALVLAAVVGLIWLAPAPYAADGPAYRAALIQPDIPQDQKWDAQHVPRNMQLLARLSAQALPVDVIIWPEAAVPFYLSLSPSWQQWLYRQADGWHTEFLFGGLKLLDADSRRAQNGLYLRTQGETQGFAAKQHLVPFGEYVPSWLPWLHKLVPDIGDFRPGSGSGVLAGRGGHFGALICYESIFPEQARARVVAGANVLVVVTNDAWYGHSPAAWQHFQASRARAVENGRFVLRAGNTGVSAIIGPDGTVRQTMPWWTAGSVRGTYRLSGAVTPYQRFGDGIMWFMLAVGGIMYWRLRRTS